MADDNKNLSNRKRNSKTHRASKGKREKKSKCDCFKLFSDNIDGNEKPKKSVRFDERVYETVFIASRLYDRRSLTKYHFSARHHPPTNRNKSGKKKNSKSETKEDHASGTKQDIFAGCRQTKSQRAKQSKRDKKKRLGRKDEAYSTDTCSSDDQGYSSSMHSFSD